MTVKHLSEGRDVADFFSKVKLKDIITYDPCWTAKQVIELGQEHDFILEYCGIGSRAYDVYGRYTCKVMSLVPPNCRTHDPVDVKAIAVEKDFDKRTWVKKKALAQFK